MGDILGVAGIIAATLLYIAMIISALRIAGSA